MRFVLSAFLLIFVCGCQSTEKATVPPAKPMTKCEAVAALVANQWATPAQHAVAIEVGRNNGCFGSTPPTKIQLEQNVTVKNAN